MVEGHGTSNPYVFYMAGIPSLCIPSMGEEDGPNGVADGLTGVTALPSGVSLAATFDPILAGRYGQVVGAEEVGKGAAVNLGPTINIDRDPRWGRSFETYTEDPFLNASLAVSEINGVQSQGELYQVKHYAVYNQETYRNTPADDVIIDNRATAGDLPARLPGRGPAGAGGVGDVLVRRDRTAASPARTVPRDDHACASRNGTSPASSPPTTARCTAPTARPTAPTRSSRSTPTSERRSWPMCRTGLFPLRAEHHGPADPHRDVPL